MVGGLKTMNGRWRKFQRPLDICLQFKFSSFQFMCLLISFLLHVCAEVAPFTLFNIKTNKIKEESSTDPFS
jgi:hypothetical protein